MAEGQQQGHTLALMGHDCPPCWFGEHSSLHWRETRYASCPYWSITPALGGRERALSEVPCPGQTGCYLPQKAMFLAGEGELSCLLGRWLLLHSCCGSGGPRPQLLAVLGGREREISLQPLPNFPAEHGALAHQSAGEWVAAGPSKTLEAPCKK